MSLHRSDDPALFWSADPGLDEASEALEQLDAVLSDHARSLTEKGEWLVCVATLVWNWSRRHLAALTPDQGGEDGKKSTERPPRDVADLKAQARGLATWLSGRQQLGRDVFVSGRQDGAVPASEGDLVAFLWASLLVFEGRPELPLKEVVLSVSRLPFPTLSEAREQLIRLLEAAQSVPLVDLAARVRGESGEEGGGSDRLRLRGAVAGSFLAGLELAKQGEVFLAQDIPFAEVRIERTDNPAVSDGSG